MKKSSTSGIGFCRTLIIRGFARTERGQTRKDQTRSSIVKKTTETPEQEIARLENHLVALDDKEALDQIKS